MRQVELGEAECLKVARIPEYALCGKRAAGHAQPALFAERGAVVR